MSRMSVHQAFTAATTRRVKVITTSFHCDKRAASIKQRGERGSQKCQVD